VGASEFSAEAKPAANRKRLFKSKEEEDEEAETTEGVDPRFVIGPEPKPKQPKKNDMSKKKMEETYGIGAKLLFGMGFSGGGLGRDGAGIANIVEVKVRKRNMGLQDEGEMVNQRLHGNEEADAEDSIPNLLRASVSGPQPAPTGDGWKAKKPQKQKTVYKTAEQIRDEQRQRTTTNKIRIVDMTQAGGARVVDASDIRSQKEEEGLSELRFNAKVLCRQAEEELAQVMREEEEHKKTLAALEKEKAECAEAGTPEQIDKEVKAFREAVTTFVNFTMRRSTDGGIKEPLDAARDALAFFRTLRKKHPQCYRDSDTDALGVACLSSAIKRGMGRWQPLDGKFDWFDLAKACRTEFSAGSFVALLEMHFVPRLKSALSSWDPRNTEPGLVLVEMWRPLLPDRHFQSLMRDSLTPRIRAAAEEWNPRKERVPVHLWVHPWLPFLQDDDHQLWTTIRTKIAACLRHWKPSDSTVRKMVEPWKPVMDPHNWGKLMEVVTERLKIHLESVTVTPGSQSLAELGHVLSWLELAGPSAIADVTVVDFFPTWLSSLRRWLKASPDYNEVVQWYKGWRSFFPPVLVADPRVERFFISALMMMARGCGVLHEDPVR